MCQDLVARASSAVAAVMCASRCAKARVSGVGRGVCGEDSGEAWAEQAVVGTAEEQRGAEAGLGDAVGVGIRQAFDHAVQAQAAELVGDGARPEGLRIAAAEFGKIGAQAGAAKAGWQQAEEDQGVP